MTRLSALASNEYFAQNPAPDIQRSTFDRSAGNKFDFSAGKLIPFYADEILPGDTFEAKLDLFARFNTPLSLLWIMPTLTYTSSLYLFALSGITLNVLWVNKKTLETLPTFSLPSSLIFPHDLSSLTHLSTTWGCQLTLQASSNMLLPFTLALLIYLERILSRSRLTKFSSCPY